MFNRGKTTDKTSASSPLTFHTQCCCVTTLYILLCEVEGSVPGKVHTRGFIENGLVIHWFTRKHQKVVFVLVDGHSPSRSGLFNTSGTSQDAYTQWLPYNTRTEYTPPLSVYKIGTR